jgi:hypothetical protein
MAFAASPLDTQLLRNGINEGLAQNLNNVSADERVGLVQSRRYRHHNNT